MKILVKKGKAIFMILFLLMIGLFVVSANAAVFDFNGDGRSDILWQHTASGTMAIWLMNGTTISSIGVPGSIPSDWQIKGVEDFHWDGKADSLWQNTSGAVAIWLMNGAAISSTGVPGAVGSDWQIVK
jgi:hypothetical protein